MFRLISKYLLKAFIPLMLVFLYACGDAGDTTTVKASITGPTSPGGYYFDFKLSPAVVAEGGNITVTVNMYTSVATTPWRALSGGTVIIAGATVTSAASLTSNSGGVAQAIFTTEGNAGTSGSITATVEDKSLTLAYAVVP